MVCYPLGCSICTDSKLCFQLGLRTHGFKNQKVKAEMIPYLPSYPVIHWKSPVDSQTLGSTELEVLGTLVSEKYKNTNLKKMHVRSSIVYNCQVKEAI